MNKSDLSSTIYGLIVLTFVASQPLQARPEQPTIDRDVHMSTQENSESRPVYTRPTLPTLQTSFDGRIALSHKLEEADGPDQVSFRLQKPEKFNGLFKDSANGTYILDNPNADASSAARISGASNSVTNLNDLSGSIGGSTNSHMGLCDPSFDHNSNINNPRSCGIGNADDCYDLWVVRFEVLDTQTNERIIHGSRVEVRVTEPKTVNATIAEVSLLERAKTTYPHIMSASFEPMFPGDGRLLFARANSSTEVPPYEGEPAMNSDVIYIINDNPDSFEACDIAQWEGPSSTATPAISNYMRPLSFAPYDETMNTRYGFAMQPFRDGQNNIIPKNIPLGTYPWVDRGADIVSLTTIGEDLYDNSGVLESNFDSSGMDLDPETSPACPADTSITCDTNVDSENGGSLTGRVMMGLWTRGKMVLIDNIINNIDFITHANDGAHRNIRLYDTGPTYKRIGNGPDNIEQRLPLGNGGNNRFLDSNEHRFNYFENTTPVTPADVVWTMSSGRGTAEVVFDDYLNPNSFILSNMAQSISVRSPNGQRDVEEDAVGNAASGGEFTINENDTVTLNNNTWAVPEQGNIIGDTRVEPIANGGIIGKGLWLDGDEDGIEYTIPAQSLTLADSSWYYSLYVDGRGAMTTDQALIHFPDGSEIRLDDDYRIRFYDTTNTLVQTYTSNEPIDLHAWVHYGFNITYNEATNRTETDIFLNGYRVQSFNENGAMFQLQENGILTVGESPNSDDLRGWVDEFKVFAEEMSPELACNMANGTLAGIDDAALANNHWDVDWADNVGTAYHTLITNTLNSDNKTTYSEYVCYHNYDDDLAAHLSNIPDGLVSVRSELLFPEGPLFHDLPRPDSSTNAFCLSCHHAEGLGGLDINALILNNALNAPQDPRRQPMQPEALVYGNIPANWLGTGLPTTAFDAGSNGMLIDELLLATSGTSSNLPVNLVSDTGTIISASNNWETAGNNQVINAYDEDSATSAQATSRGTASEGRVYIDFVFDNNYTDFTVTIEEDNSSPYQVSRWKVQTFINGVWSDLPQAWEANNTANETEYPIDYSLVADRLRIMFEAPSNNQVGVEEITITGVLN